MVFDISASMSFLKNILKLFMFLFCSFLPKILTVYFLYTYYVLHIIVSERAWRSIFFCAWLFARHYWGVRVLTLSRSLNPKFGTAAQRSIVLPHSLRHASDTLMRTSPHYDWMNLFFNVRQRCTYVEKQIVLNFCPLGWRKF